MKSDYIRRPITDAERINLGFLDEWPIDGLLSMGGMVAEAQWSLQSSGERI